MSKLLINENPVMIIPSIAVKIGLNEAVMLQQIHYWVQMSSNEIEGKKWIFNTYKDWQKHLPFWSESTIKRSIKSLEDKGYTLSANWNRSKMDKTKWYTINYEKIKEFESNNLCESSFDQTDQTKDADWDKEAVSLIHAIPENTTEISPEIKKQIVEEAGASIETFQFFERNGFGTIGGLSISKNNKLV